VLFNVHKNVLLQSPFFAIALRPEWAAMREGDPMDRTDERPTIFKAYLQWLYSHRVDDTYDTIEWARMYVLGEKFMDLELQDSVLETKARGCQAKNSYLSFSSTIEIIYDGTLPASPARKLLVDFYCWAGGSKWAEDRDFAGRAWAEFVNDLIRELMASKGTVKKGYPWVKDLAS
jgi:hypothetical protein